MFEFEMKGGVKELKKMEASRNGLRESGESSQSGGESGEGAEGVPPAGGDHLAATPIRVHGGPPRGLRLCPQPT